MRWVYPGAFVAMAIEGALTGPAPRDVLMGGLALFGLAKALKIWAISSLGSKWSYRVLVVPGEPLVTTGPYRFISHPNYSPSSARSSASRRSSGRRSPARSRRSPSGGL